MKYKIRLYTTSTPDPDAPGAQHIYEYPITLDQIDSSIASYLKGGWKLSHIRIVRIEEIPVRIREGERTLVVPTYFVEDEA